MHVHWTQGTDEAVTPEGFTALAAALERRGLDVVPADVRQPAADVVLVAAPRVSLGPDRVRAWRAEAEKGSHILVFGRPDSVDVADVGMALPGLQVAPTRLESWELAAPASWEDGDRPMALAAPSTHIEGRRSARIQPPDGQVPGRLFPKGTGWFRFARSWDVSHAWSCGEGWAFVQLRIGAGSLGLFADASLLSDERLAERDHRRLMTRLLDAWLPSLHALHLNNEPVAAALPRSRWLERLEAGCDPMSVFTPGGPIAAVRTLAEAGLVETVDGRLRLSAAGRDARPRVQRVLGLQRAFALEDDSVG